MRYLSSTDVAIAKAIKTNGLRVVERASRFGGTCFAIEDATGVIEVQATRAELTARLSPFYGAAQ